MKKIIILVLIISIIGIGIYLLKPKEIDKKEVKTNIQTNEKITKEQKIDNILISNISLVTKNKKTIFSAKITNLTANEINYKTLKVIVKNKNKELVSLICYFGGKLNPEETKIVTAETNTNLKDANALEFKLQN